MVNVPECQLKISRGLVVRGIQSLNSGNEVRATMSDEKLDAFGWLADHTGCGVIRIKQPLDALASELGYKTMYNERMVKTEEELPRALIGQRVCKDGPSQLFFNIGVKKERPRMVFEVDDDLCNVDPSN